MATKSIQIDTFEQTSKIIPENLNKFRSDSKGANVFSYGNVTGNYFITETTLATISSEKNILQSYAFVEKKTEYYKLIFDIDYKNRDKDQEYSKYYINQTDNITNYIIQNIITVLNSIIDKPDISYIYADKHIELGIHLYFPHIIVDKKLHQYIQNKLFDLCVKNDTFGLNSAIWDKVLDKCVAGANGLRLLYYRINGDFYKPNKDKSTIEIPTKRKDLMMLSFIRTDYDAYNFDLIIDPDELVEKIIQKPKEKKAKTITITIPDDINIPDCEHLDLANRKDMCNDLLELISVKRIDNYDTWLNLVYFCKNYGLYDEIINLSKKSSKFDDESVKLIKRIFEKNMYQESHISVGSLIYWARQDSYLKAMCVLRKYNMTTKLDIKNSDDFLQYGSNITYDFTESSKHISNNAKKAICNAIKNKGVRTIVCHSGTGTGKTTSTEHIVNYYVKEMLDDDATLDDCGIISIVTRKSMDACHQTSFKTFTLASYQTCNEFSTKYITSIEHLKYYNANRHSYGIVILDEINSLIGYIYSSTLNGRRKECLQNLCHIIQNASLVICCDANITSMVTSFLRLQGDPFGKTFYYKNTFKNKEGVAMNIYNSKYVEKPNKNDPKYKTESNGFDAKRYKIDDDNRIMQNSENSKIMEFCKLMENDVKNGKSVLIFSDSKDISIKVKECLLKYNSKKSYFKLFNKNEGTLDEIIDCNKTFLNHCVICSPKLLYGVDILIEYARTYCIYKYNSSENSIGSLGYHQQYSRSRNTQEVNILILDPFFATSVNHFITFEEHKISENIAFNKYKKSHIQLCNTYNVIDELCSQFSINGIKIDNDSLFADVCYYKTWFDKLFHKNKFQLVLKIAEESGYNIQHKELKVTKLCEGLNKCLDTDKIKLVDIMKRIMKGEDVKCRRIKPNIVEQIDARKQIINFDDKFTKASADYIDLLCNDKKFNAYLNKKYLDLPKAEFDKIAIKLNNTDLACLAKDNKLINKIKSLELVEKLLGIERYKVDAIDKNINLNNTKIELLKIVDKLIILFDGIQSKARLTKRVTVKINKIMYLDQLQKFMADCYNSFGDIIGYNSRYIRITIDNARIQRNKYDTFVIISQIKFNDCSKK